MGDNVVADGRCEAQRLADAGGLERRRRQGVIVSKTKIDRRHAVSREFVRRHAEGRQRRVARGKLRRKPVGALQRLEVRGQCQDRARQLRLVGDAGSDNETRAERRIEWSERAGAFDGEILRIAAAHGDQQRGRSATRLRACPGQGSPIASRCGARNGTRSSRAARPAARADNRRSRRRGGAANRRRSRPSGRRAFPAGQDRNDRALRAGHR